jgi:hypothetical protein
LPGIVEKRAIRMTRRWPRRRVVLLSGALRDTIVARRACARASWEQQDAEVRHELLD